MAPGGSSSSSSSSNSSDSSEGAGGGEGATAGGDFEALASELEAARAAQAVLEGLADQHAANVEFGSATLNHAEAAVGGPGDLFSDTVLMSETERILGLIDAVELQGQSASRPASEARP
jgi:hypothetical protein